MKNKEKKICEAMEMWSYNKKTRMAEDFIGTIIGNNLEVFKLSDAYFIEKQYFTNEEANQRFKKIK